MVIKWQWIYGQPHYWTSFEAKIDPKIFLNRLMVATDSTNWIGRLFLNGINMGQMHRNWIWTIGSQITDLIFFLKLKFIRHHPFIERNAGLYGRALSPIRYNCPSRCRRTGSHSHDPCGHMSVCSCWNLEVLWCIIFLLVVFRCQWILTRMTRNAAREWRMSDVHSCQGKYVWFEFKLHFLKSILIHIFQSHAGLMFIFGLEIKLQF